MKFLRRPHRPTSPPSRFSPCLNVYWISVGQVTIEGPSASSVNESEGFTISPSHLGVIKYYESVNDIANPLGCYSTHSFSALILSAKY